MTKAPLGLGSTRPLPRNNGTHAPGSAGAAKAAGALAESGWRVALLRFDLPRDHNLRTLIKALP